MPCSDAADQVVRSDKETLITPAHPGEFIYHLLELPDTPKANLLPQWEEVLSLSLPPFLSHGLSFFGSHHPPITRGRTKFAR